MREVFTILLFLSLSKVSILFKSGLFGISTNTIFDCGFITGLKDSGNCCTTIGFPPLGGENKFCSPSVIFNFSFGRPLPFRSNKSIGVP